MCMLKTLIQNNLYDEEAHGDLRMYDKRSCRPQRICCMMCSPDNDSNLGHEDGKQYTYRENTNIQGQDVFPTVTEDKASV